METVVSIVVGSVLIPGGIWLANLHARVGKLEVIAENTSKILDRLLEIQLEKK